MNKQDWLDHVKNVDFDPQNKAQNRVWARVTAPRRRAVLWRRPAVWAACLLLFVVAGGLWRGVLVPHAQPEELTEETCAELNSRFLLASALARAEEDCPCHSSLTPFDRQTVRHLRKELHEAAGAVCSPEEQVKLKQCNLKFKPKLQTLALCKTLC